jgi:small neutral amino acid transporter SnatA (MarC family)
LGTSRCRKTRALVASTSGNDHGWQDGLVNWQCRPQGQTLYSLIGVTLVAATVFVAYRYADRLGRMMGETGMNVLLGLSAFILLCIGVQIVWNGASALLRTLAE